MKKSEMINYLTENIKMNAYLATITDKHDESAYEDAVNEAVNDITNANYDIVKMLDMAGYDGKEYYELNK